MYTDVSGAQKFCFRNYGFTEKDDQLVIEKSPRPPESRYKDLVQGESCCSLSQQYTEYLIQKLVDLSNFNPPFASDTAKEQYEAWRNHKILGMNGKLSDPLKALQSKVASRVEELFKRNGARKIILGCMHIEKGCVINQTDTDEVQLLPQTSHKEEDHSHQDSVAFDLRVSPAAISTVPLDNSKFCAVMAEFSFDKRGPDFANRNFEFVDCVSDLSRLSNVDQVYAERVPALEHGAHSCSGAAVFEQVQMINQILKPGGRYIFDLGVPLYLVSSKGEYVSSKQWMPRAQELRKAIVPKISPIIAEQIRADELFKKSLCKMHESGVLELNKDLRLADRSSDAFFNRFALHFADHLAKGKARAKQFEIWRAEAKIYITENPEKVVIKADDISIEWTEEFGQTTRRKSIKGSELSKGKAAKLFAVFAAGKTFRLPPDVLLRTKELPFEQQFAIGYQVDLYNAIPVLPAGHPDLAFLQPKNKELFDRVIRAYATHITIPQLKTYGFKSGTFELDAKNPENGRTAGRLVTMVKV